MAKTDLNLAILQGTVSRVERRATPSGSTVLSFAVTTEKSYIGKDKQPATSKMMHWVTSFGKQAEFFGKGLEDGAYVSLVGSPYTSSYDKNGVKTYSTKIAPMSVTVIKPGAPAQQAIPQTQPIQDGIGEVDLEDLEF